MDESDKQNYTIFGGVKITPKQLQFQNAYEGKSFKEKITFQNVSKKSVIIRTLIPTSYAFKSDRLIHSAKLSCGLSVAIWISYTFTHASTMFSYLTVYVDNTRTDIPIEVLTSKGEIYCVPRNLNFEKINIGYAVHVRKMRFYNKGNKQTKFEFDWSHTNLGITINPKKGFIPGQQSTEVEVDLIGFEEGVYTKEIWVKCEHPFRFTLFVEVIKPKLYICSPHDYTESFLPIMFPPIYGGCREIQVFDVFNFNMLNTTYIIVPEYNFEIMAAHKAEELNPDFKRFFINPIEGDLKPSESRSIEISFVSSRQKLMTDRIYFVCFRLIRLECQTVDKVIREQLKDKPIEQKKQIISLDDTASIISFDKLELASSDVISLTKELTKMQKMSFNDYIRICAYAIVKSIKVEVEPLNFTLDEITVNTEIEAFLTIFNRSKTLPIYFEYEKGGHINVEPPTGFIQILGFVRVKVIFAPKGAGLIDKPIRFKLLYYSQPPNQKQKVLNVVGSIDVPVYIPVKNEYHKPKPKFNMGITPNIGNAVGFMTNDIRFNSKIKKPKMAMLQCYTDKPSKRFDNAIIAFPNDRPAALQPWRNKDVKCKTIFAGLSRVIAPEDEYMFTPDELLKKTENDNYYLNYIRANQKIRWSLNQQEVWEDYLTNDKKLFQNVKDLVCPTYWQHSGSYQKGFAPLKPIQIYFVKINPSKIFIKGVVVNSTVSYEIEIFNENKFPVHIMLTSFHRHKKTLPGLPDDVTVNSNEKITFVKEFCPNLSGVFNTILNVYLNSSHLVPVLLQAEIVKPTVTVDFTEIIFDDNTSYTKLMALKNVLNVPIKFELMLPSGSCYEVRPKTGTIPPGRFIHCELIYTPDYDKRSCVKLSIHCEDGNTVLIHVNSCYTKCNVEILEQKIDLQNMPINIRTIRKNILRNQGLEMVLFKIRNVNPCYGVTIEPEKGCIYGRCDVELTMTFLFDSFIKFYFKVEVEFEHGQGISFIVSGFVDCPIISCKPSEPINIRRIPAGSFEIVPFTIHNKGESDVHLSFPKSTYPELTVAGTSRVDISLKENVALTLEKDETVQLYIHFHPLDVCMNSVYLPIVLNNLIGPAEKYDAGSVYPHRYVKDVSLLTCDDGHIEEIHYKNKISVLTVNTVSTKHILRFSKTFLKFSYLVACPRRSVSRCEFKVKNSSKKVVEFCFEVRDMAPNFEIKCKTSQNVSLKDEEVMVVSIENEEELTFNVCYIPVTPGEYVCNLPVYIKNVKDGAVFNYIKLKASYPPPTFDCPLWYFLEPVPLDVMMTYDVEMKLLYHLPDCSTTVFCDTDQLTFLFKTGAIDLTSPNCERVVYMRMQFVSSTPISKCTKVNISCTCGAQVFVIVGVVASDDIITTYAHQCLTIPRESVMKSRGFPYFPADSDDSDFAKFMRRTVTVVEKWLYEQALNLSYYYFIPQDMSGNYRPPVTKKKNKQKTILLLQIIHNMCGIGNDILPRVECQHIVNDEISRVNHLHCSLKLTLIFLNKQGAFFPHIRSRYLVTYPEYVLYMTKVRPMKGKNIQPIKSEELYMRRSKQCWLDLILTIYKVLIQPRIAFKKLSARLSTGLKMDLSTSNTCMINLSPDAGLLSWLDIIYRQENEILLSFDKNLPKGFVLSPKQLTNYTTDLSNSLALITVTLQHCPYLKPYLKDIYVVVDAPEKAFHNAVQLVEAWKLINCSFKITPMEIVEPMALQMVFLAMYIFDAFNTLQTKEDLYFTASLSCTDYKEIIIRNPNNSDLNYDVRILNNEHDCFKIANGNNLIKVSAGKTYKIIIEYTAKRMYTVNATLLLCGDTPGQQYCKSVAYSLSGTSNFLGEHVQVVFEVDLYKSIDVLYELVSPYKEACTYNMMVQKCSPKDVVVKDLIPVSVYFAFIRPRTIHSKIHTITTDENGVGMASLRICCLSTNDFEATILFTNPVVGDFFISIVVQPVNFNLIEKCVLVVDLPSDWDQHECNCCGQNKLINPIRCPKRVVLKIPCKNDQFWSIITSSIMQCVPEGEAPVWKKFLENEMGPYILQWLMINSLELKTVHILDYNITYNVINKHSEIRLPDTVRIGNVRSDNFIDVEMHIMGNVDTMKKIDFSLQSEDGKEFRWYSIEFRRTSSHYSPRYETARARELLTYSIV